MSHTIGTGRVPAATHAQRRRQLMEKLGRPVLLLGNGVRARNLPMTPLPFRQDSTFLYFTGCREPDAAILIDRDGSRLYLPEPAPDDPLWHGDVPTFAELGATFDVAGVFDTDRLADDLRDVAEHPATLAIADEARNAWIEDELGVPLRFGDAFGDDDLVSAVIELRRPKTAIEVGMLRQAAKHTAAAHKAVAAGAKPGVHERSLVALFRAVLGANGCTEGYPTILTQRGEVLHNFHHEHRLEAGTLLLVDGGGEVEEGYGCDVTRTWPVSGMFQGRQRAAYEAVLAAQDAAIDRCRAGVRYRHVHDTACRVLADFLVDERLVTISADEAVATGAHALFFPHGVGHLLGLDVHDLENFGDLPSYPIGRGRPDQFGTCYLRLDRVLEPGWVVTVEPGFYVVPAILHDAALRQRFDGKVDFERAEKWLGFGGIRIEDDILVTDGAPDNLTEAVPRSVPGVEALTGRGVAISAVLDA